MPSWVTEIDMARSIRAESGEGAKAFLGQRFIQICQSVENFILGRCRIKRHRVVVPEILRLFGKAPGLGAQGRWNVW